MGKNLLAVELDHVVSVWQECLASGIFSLACPWEEAVRSVEWSWREMAVAGSEEACWRWASSLPRVPVLPEAHISLSTWGEGLLIRSPSALT